MKRIVWLRMRKRDWDLLLAGAMNEQSRAIIERLRKGKGRRRRRYTAELEYTKCLTGDFPQ